jgi:hypothetical protein
MQWESATWDWTPAKGFFPMVRVLANEKKKIPFRSDNKKYNRKEVIDLYRGRIEYYWNQNLNIVFGTEAMDYIVKVSNGAALLKMFSKSILPQSVDPRQITVVVAYRTPKVKHLISVWHENMADKSMNSTFYEWITTTDNNLGALDALGMVKMFLRYTEWNVVLLDLEGLRVNQWDESFLVACEILQGTCSNRALTNTYNEELKEPIVTNARSHEQEPNVPQKALDEMEQVLRLYDCNYKYMLHRELDGHRLKIYYPIGLDETMKYCSSRNKTNTMRRQPRSEMVSNIKKICLKYGKVN